MTTLRRTPRFVYCWEVKKQAPVTGPAVGHWQPCFFRLCGMRRSSRHPIQRICDFGHAAVTCLNFSWYQIVIGGAPNEMHKLLFRFVGFASEELVCGTKPSSFLFGALFVCVAFVAVCSFVLVAQFKALSVLWSSFEVRCHPSPHHRCGTPHWAAPEVLRMEALGPAAVP